MCDFCKEFDESSNQDCYGFYERIWQLPDPKQLPSELEIMNHINKELIILEDFADVNSVIVEEILDKLDKLFEEAVYPQNDE